MTGMVRKSAAAFAVASSVLLVSITGASAVSVTIPKGKAHAAALKVSLTLPSAAQLNAILTSLGLPGTVPDNDMLGKTYTQIVALNSAVTTGDKAETFAAPLSGNLAPEQRASSASCAEKTCDSSQAVAASSQELPNGLGIIEIAGAKSSATSRRDASSTTALAHVRISLSELTGPNGPLAAVGGVFKTLADTINGQSTTIDGALDTINTQVGGLLNDIVGSDASVSVGPTKTFPNLSEVDLLNLTILAGSANLVGTKGFVASAESRVTDVSALGNYLTIDSIEASATASVVGDPVADPKLNLDGVNLGGIVGVRSNLQSSVTKAAANVRRIVESKAPEQAALVKDQLDDVQRAAKILDLTAGVSLSTTQGLKLEEKKTVGEVTSKTAEAASDLLSLTIAPRIVNPNALKAGTVPDLDESDFFASGLVLKVDFPQAAASAAVGVDVLGEQLKRPRTGVGTPIVLALVLIGAAIVVKRYVLNK